MRIVLSCKFQRNMTIIACLKDFSQSDYKVSSSVSSGIVLSGFSLFSSSSEYRSLKIYKDITSNDIKSFK